MSVVQFMVVILLFAGNDNNIEWNGVTHIDWLDRAPVCPVDGESFTVSFQTYHYDITSARVHVDDGSVTWVDAAWSHERGPYDVWTATIPASSPTGTLDYYIELTDGSDTDYLGPAGMSESPPATPWHLDFVTASHAPVGTTLTSDGGAVFKLWAPPPSWYPTGDWISVRGDFNSWNCTALSHDGDYYWYARVPNVSAGHEYKYYFWDSSCGNNDWDWHEDARYRTVDRYNYNNAVVVDPAAYSWTLKDFDPPDFEELVIYELHVGTFSGYNDGLNRMGLFRDVVDTHLDHLQYLGVNAVELMPITEFDGYESWGYNPINHWAPEESYGNPDDLKYMIDKLHQAGVAVLIDVVYNHFSSGGNYLWDYGDLTYFDRDGGDPGCDTPWGAQAAFWRQEVKDYYAQNVQYWFEEYGVDGIRMDATSYMRPPLGCYEDGWYLMQRINNEIDARAVRKIAIAEELPDDAWITRATGLDGAGFDSQWHDRFTDDVRQEIFDAAYGDPEMWKVRDALLGRLNDAGGSYITDWGQSTTQLVNYVEAHDEADDARLAVVIDGADPYSVWAKGRSKLAQGLTILAPGIPMFIQGGEWMEDITFGAGYGNRIDWAKAVGRAPIVQFFRDVIAVRQGNCGLRSNAGCEVHHVDDTGNVLAFHRWCASGNDLIVVASFNNGDLYNYRIGFPQHGTWYELLNSQAVDYLGNGSGNGGSVTTDEGYAYDGLPHSATLTVPQMGLLVLRYNDPPEQLGDLNCDDAVNTFDIDAFVLALTDPTGYEAAYPDCDRMLADCNQDGSVNTFDIDPFVALLTG